MAQGAKRPLLTHFLCIPLITTTSRPQLERSLHDFRQRVSVVSPENPHSPSTSAGDEGPADGIKKIDPRAFKAVGSLHLTLGVMGLDPNQVDAASNLLSSLDINQLLRDVGRASTERSSTEPLEKTPALNVAVQPLVVELKGLEPMHEPDSTSILYIPPHDSTGRLYNFCLALQKKFKEEGYLIEEHRDLRLHATVVNTHYAKDKKGAVKDKIHGPVGQRQFGTKGVSTRKLDARDIIEEFKDYVWAEDFTLDRLAICEMGAKKQCDPQGNVVDEVYTEIARTQLPGTQSKVS